MNIGAADENMVVDNTEDEAPVKNSDELEKTVETEAEVKAEETKDKEMEEN